MEKDVHYDYEGLRKSLFVNCCNRLLIFDSLWVFLKVECGFMANTHPLTYIKNNPNILNVDPLLIYQYNIDLETYIKLLKDGGREVALHEAGIQVNY